ncbi:MAG: beta-ketoacyl-ACP synthase II [Clostridia bacterium]|nr:beta-ketoacyl-[acyl-carrier-protein] synthase II [Oscillospiraceae bacterium]MBQ7960222.1 beta-ketoacyl-ACP synthase II [Clostridia bacterium]
MKRVVITGMGAVTPVGCNVDTFWESLKNGKSGIDYISKFDTSEYRVKVAAEIRDFDPTPYMEKAEVRRSDKFVQYAVAAASMAVADSGIENNVAPERFGVYYGSGIGGFDTFIAEHNNMINRGPLRVSPLFIPKMIANMGAGNIAIKFGAKGPCISVSTACATGTTAIGEAFRAIKGGYADAIIAGGVEASINEMAVAAFMNCMALSESEDPKTASIPFDKRRGGFVMGEGAGALIVEEYEHAKARGAKIYAEVVGYGSTCDAFHVTAPDDSAESSGRAISDCLKETGRTFDAEKVYINAHGTSTPLNDKTETRAIKNAFGEDAYKVHVSSTKSMTGHLLGAAGAVEGIAAILALNENIIPPTIGYAEADEECDLDYTPNTAKKTEVDLAMSTSLGFGGHNACVAFAKI